MLLCTDEQTVSPVREAAWQVHVTLPVLVVNVRGHQCRRSDATISRRVPPWHFRTSLFGALLRSHGILVMCVCVLVAKLVKGRNHFFL